MKNSEIEKIALGPLTRTDKKFYVFLVILLMGIAWFLYAWHTQLTRGLMVTGMRDLGTMGGVPWGIYITNFIFFIGITTAGIAIASAIRLLNLKDFIPIARIAELITIFSLAVAGLSIILDLGRPDRVFNMILYYTERIGQSPMIWDITAVTAYMVFAVTYLYMEMREDLARLANKVRFGRLYKLLLPMYEPGERERIERIIWWASLFNFPLMVMVHTQVAWIFGLMPARPGWYSAIMGPYYVAGAILSGMAVMVVAAAIYRQVFKWHDLISINVFRTLGRFLSWVTIIYLYFLLAENLTVMYAGFLPELAVSEAIIHSDFALAFWTQIAVLCIAFVIFFLPTINPKFFKIWLTTIASALVVITLWVTRFLIVVPSLTRAYHLYPHGIYTPTWVEWSIVAGAFIIIIFLFTLFTKIFPIIPITEIEKR